MVRPIRTLLLTLLTTLVLVLAGCTAAPSGEGADDGSTSPDDADGADPGTPTSPTDPNADPDADPDTDPDSDPDPTTSPTTHKAKGPVPVDLRSAASYAVLTKSGISTTGTTAITGDLGVSPIGSTAITGFGLIMHTTNEYATSSLVTGKVYASDYTAPTPARMTQAISDMETAYADAAGRVDPTATELGAGNIAGMTLEPGLYKWGTGLIIPTDVVLSGGPDDVWIFQVAQTLDLGTDAKIVLSGGAQASNVFWQVEGQVTLATGSAFQGTILGYSAIVLETGATLDGRALAQASTTLDANAVTRT